MNSLPPVTVTKLWYKYHKWYASFLYLIFSFGYELKARFPHYSTNRVVAHIDFWFSHTLPFESREDLLASHTSRLPWCNLPSQTASFIYLFVKKKKKCSNSVCCAIFIVLLNVSVVLTVGTVTTFLNSTQNQTDLEFTK